MQSSDPGCTYSQVERIEPGGHSSVLLTCEHASARLPANWAWPNADTRLETDHWGVDVGIAQLTREIAYALQIPAVLAGTSRLLVDCNRTPKSDTLFRLKADNIPIWLNQGLSPRERQARLNEIYRPYHEAISAACRSFSPRLVLSMHSYTPLYEGSPRAVQVGVLHDGEPRLADVWRATLQNELPHYDIRVNEPWSGIGGYMYSAVMHAEECGATAMELEIRNDLLVPQNTERLISAIQVLLQSYLHT